jgi:hypothetical protein
MLTNSLALEVPQRDNKFKRLNILFVEHDLHKMTKEGDKKGGIMSKIKSPSTLCCLGVDSSGKGLIFLPSALQKNLPILLAIF